MLRRLGLLILLLAVAGGAVAQTSVLLEWSPPSQDDVADYTIYRGYTVAGLAEFIAGITDTSWTDNNVSADSSYVYAVTAVDDSDNESAQSDTTIAYIIGDAPSTPTDVAATGGDTQITVTWTDPNIADADSASIYYGTGTGGPYTLYSSGLDITLETSDITGLTNDTPYYVVITFTDNADQESSQSSEVSATPEAAAANGFVGTRLAVTGNEGWSGGRDTYTSIFAADSTGTIRHIYVRSYSTEQDFDLIRPWIRDAAGDTLGVAIDCGGSPVSDTLRRYTLPQDVSVTAGTNYQIGYWSSDNSFMLPLAGTGSYYVNDTPPDGAATCPLVNATNVGLGLGTEDTSGLLPVWASNHSGEDGS